MKKNIATVFTGLFLLLSMVPGLVFYLRPEIGANAYYDVIPYAFYCQRAFIVLVPMIIAVFYIADMLNKGTIIIAVVGYPLLTLNGITIILQWIRYMRMGLGLGFDMVEKPSFDNWHEKLYLAESRSFLLEAIIIGIVILLFAAIIKRSVKKGISAKTGLIITLTLSVLILGAYILDSLGYLTDAGVKSAFIHETWTTWLFSANTLVPLCLAVVCFFTLSCIALKGNIRIMGYIISAIIIIVVAGVCTVLFSQNAVWQLADAGRSPAVNSFVLQTVSIIVVFAATLISHPLKRSEAS